MSGRRPLGPEVQRVAVERGAMLYDSSRAGNLSVSWFDPGHWESQGAIEGRARGRGLACFIRAEGLRLVLREYRRGGLIARLLRRHYLWKGEDGSRPFREWLLTYRMHRAGLPVAAPIAARYRRRLGLYSGELITERLEVKGSLADCLMAGPVPLPTWVAIGRCIRRFHDFGVCHADLNIRNILVGADTVYLIDFDRCTLRRPGLWHDGNLVRLRRSLEKVTYGLPRDRFSEADWHALLEGYRQAGRHPVLAASTSQTTQSAAAAAVDNALAAAAGAPAVPPTPAPVPVSTPAAPPGPAPASTSPGPAGTPPPASGSASAAGSAPARATVPPPVSPVQTAGRAGSAPALPEPKAPTSIPPPVPTPPPAAVPAAATGATPAKAASPAPAAAATSVPPVAAAPPAAAARPPAPPPASAPLPEPRAATEAATAAAQPPAAPASPAPATPAQPPQAVPAKPPGPSP